VSNLAQKKAVWLLQLMRTNWAIFTSKRGVAIAYDVPESTLRMRLLGTRTHQESRSVNLKLTETEKLTHVEWILSIANRGLPVCQASIREMANLLLQKQISTNNTPKHQVGQNWVYNFIKRHDSLKSKCEDPTTLRNWFRLVQNKN
jgi:hypothetical protein